MQVSRRGGCLGWGCLLALVFLSGCRREQPSTFDSNLPPETIISGAPAESSQAYYRVHIKWYGVDPDGGIDHYEYAVTDTNKVPGEDTPGFAGFFSTTRTDSVFVFTANLPQILGHRFYVRAVDQEGKTDPTPAWTYFVAEDLNVPQVQFKTGVGTWIDRNGDLRSTTITSFQRFTPKDTIGVGGAVTVSWTGFDVDVGDSVVGFEYRLSSDPAFGGGTLGDTTATVSFARPAGSRLTTYYSGVEAIQVRAIDVAGAKTSPDSVRSFVVNFNPIAWVVDPQQVDPPVRRRVFTEVETQNVWESGTVLADGLRTLQFKFTGFDDPRDMSLDPNNPTGIIGFTARTVKNGGGLAFAPVQTWKPFPLVSDFVTAQLTSGDYVILLRAQDELERHGAPESLRVGINYIPYLEFVRYLDGSGVEQDLWIPRPPGQDPDTVFLSLAQEPGGGYADFRVRFLARDDHSPPPGTHELDPNPVVESELGRILDYQSRLNGFRSGFEAAPLDSLGQPTVASRTYLVDPGGSSGVIRSGINRLEITARDQGGRSAKLEFTFHVSLE